MPNQLRDIRTVDETSYPYIFEQNVSVYLQNGGVIRCNVYRPKSSTGTEKKYPVLVTYGPYGKDIPYESFNPHSFKEINPAHKTQHSSWETPTPKYWTEHGYVVVRADEVGSGQSPGFLNPTSAATIDAFCDLIEWASEQPWSTGKVGLLGISYFAATQWQAAARNPKGLTAAVPWEGYSDRYRDSGRHGGIQSSGFIRLWWARQVASNQYGLPGRAERNWGPDTIEGDLSEEELKANRVASPDEAPPQRYRDNESFASANYNLEDIKIPFLSVANWGGILLHLRGNVEGFMRASSELKYLRFIVGRHDLPFFYEEEVELQRSFLDAFLKDDDRLGWSKKGAIAPVDLILRKGDVGYNDPVAERTFLRRSENEWPIARTQYTKMFLNPDGKLLFEQPFLTAPTESSYNAPGSGKPSDIITFVTPAFERETELTGHTVAHLNVSVNRKRHSQTTPSDIDLFVTLRHISSKGNEILYTGTMGEGVPITKGFLRVSLRKVNPDHPRHASWLPHRDYLSTDVLPVIPNDIYAVDVELGPTNVVVEAGGQLLFEISSGDTSGSGVFTHDNPVDR
ncbi:hypothetical protein AWENTII_005687 [Aspergillus wentii]